MSWIGGVWHDVQPVVDPLNVGGVIADRLDQFGQKLKSSLYPDAPPPLANTPAAVAASNYANKLVRNQGTLATPTYGSAGQVNTGVKPTAPDQSDYDLVSGKTYGTAAPTTSAQAQATADATGRPAALYPGSSQPAPVGADLTTYNGNAGFGGAGLAGDAATRTAPTAAPSGQDILAHNDAAVASQKAAAQARIDAYNQQLAQYNAIYGADAQQSNAQVGATQVGAPTTGYQFGMQAPQIGAAPQLGGAPQIDVNGLGTVAAQQINAPGAIRAGSVTAQQLGPQSMAQVGNIAQGGQARDAQVEGLNMYRDVANGTAPSAAQALLRKGIDENVGAQLGMAATLQGNTPGLAMRSGLSGAANAIAKSSADMAALRAQEQETGRAGFMQAATGIRSADIAIAQSNQTKDLTSSVQTMQANLDAMKSNQAAALSAGQTNVAADLQAKIQTASNQLDASKASAANSLSADVANLTAKLDASKANQAAQVQQNIANLSARLETEKANLQSALQTGIAGEADKLQSSIAQMNAQLDAEKVNQQALLDAAKANQQNSQYNATLGQQQQQFESGLASSNAQANADRGLAQQTINNNLYSNMTGQATTALGVPLGVAAQDQAKYLDWQKQNSATTAALGSMYFNAAGKILGA